MKKLKAAMPYILQILLTSIIGLSVYLRDNNITVLTIILYLSYNLYFVTYFKIKENDNERFISNINEGISKNLCNICMPVVLINKAGEVLWHNEKFSAFKEDEEIVGKNIISIVRGLNIDKKLDDINSAHQRLKFDGVLYDVYSENILKGKDKYRLIYFNDVSELVGLENVKESVMLLEVDNLNEALDRTDEENKPLVVAEVERTINAYAHKLRAMVKKYDTNKYVLSIQDRYIEDEVERQFPILNEVSKIDKGNKLELTLSIGIGRGGVSPYENNSFAVIAKELALGRGGDQVVIKKNDQLRFFGGNTKEIEKRTRVRARVVSHALKELIYESSKVYIVGHKTPDMDCFGASIALSSIIKQLGKECHVLLNEDNNAIEYYLNKLRSNERYKDRFISEEDAIDNMDDDTLVVIVDVHNKGYVNNYNLVQKAKKKVIIDHHRRSADIIESTTLNYIEVYASSTSEMVTEIIQYIVDNPKLIKEEAEGLLAGIFMDTKGFSFKTGVRTFEAASFLRNKGADTMEIKKMFRDNLEDYLRIAETIKTAQVDYDNNTAIAICPKNVDTVIIAKAADELLNISGISACFVLGEVDENNICISGRSTGDVNVQVVLESLGGGGHMNIAGAKITDESMEEVVEKLKEKITKYLRVGE